MPPCRQPRHHAVKRSSRSSSGCSITCAGRYLLGLFQAPGPPRRYVEDVLDESAHVFSLRILPLQCGPLHGPGVIPPRASRAGKKTQKWFPLPFTDYRKASVHHTDVGVGALAGSGLFARPPRRQGPDGRTPSPSIGTPSSIRCATLRSGGAALPSLLTGSPPSRLHLALPVLGSLGHATHG